MKVKEGRMKIRKPNITESEYVLHQCKDVFRHGFKAIADKHSIKLSEFMEKLDETFDVNDYRNKNEEDFLNTLMIKVVEPVFENNGIKLIS